MYKILRRIGIPCFASLAMVLAVPASAQIIKTVAGGGPNNLPALSANLDAPGAVVVDASGNLYIATQNKVLRVDKSNGQLTVYAGGGDSSADGIPATSADLCFIGIGMALDSAGNLFISDFCESTVRRVDAATRVITTVAGKTDQHCGAECLGFSGDGGPATSAVLARPTGLVVDSAGNLFIADSLNNRVRRVDASTRVVTTVAGGGTTGLGDGGPATSAEVGPSGLVLDSAGNLLIADTGNQLIRRVDAATQIITTVAGNGFKDGCCSGGFNGDSGPATSIELDDPAGLAVDGAGNLFIADSLNYRIRRLDATTGVMTTVAGSGGCCGSFSGDGGPATSAKLDTPTGLALDSAGNLLIADLSNFRIRRVDSATQAITTVAGNGTMFFSGDGGLATSASIDAVGAAIDSAGNLFIADGRNNRIRRVDAATGIITTVAGNGRPGFSGDGGPATSAELNYPPGVAVDGAGNLLIADRLQIRRVDAATGIITTVVGNGNLGDCGGSSTPSAVPDVFGVAVDPAGHLWITVQPGGPPGGLPNGQLCRFDASTGLIGRINLGNVDPAGVAVDHEGNAFVAANVETFYVDFGLIFRVDSTTQAVTQVAGREYCPGGPPDCRFFGDGGPATSAVMDGALSVAVDGGGNLFIADLGNNRVRRVDASTQVITTVAGVAPGGLAIDNAGNLFTVNGSLIRRVVMSDTTPPVTTATASPAPNSNGWNNTNVTVTLNSADNEPSGTGIKQVRYSLAGAQTVGTQTVAGSTAPVTISAEGATTLNFLATDNAGNAEQSKALTVQIDKTPPAISGMSASGCSLWPPNSNMVTVATITAADALSGLASGSFQVTGSSNEPSDPNNPDVVITPHGSGSYTVQLRAARLGSGTGRTYTLRATATDLAGNTATSTATCTVPHDMAP